MNGVGVWFPFSSWMLATHNFEGAAKSKGIGVGQISMLLLPGLATEAGGDDGGLH